MTTVTKDELVKRLSRMAYRASGMPIGLHCWPRAEHWTNDEEGRRHHNPHWYGIGPVDWGGDATLAWFDIRINDIDYGYRAVNRLLADACKEAGLEFINMA